MGFFAPSWVTGDHESEESPLEDTSPMPTSSPGLRTVQGGCQAQAG